MRAKKAFQSCLRDCGIGRTRWAIHGVPCDENSQPPLDQSGKVAVVHTCVIENFDRLKDRLTKAGTFFIPTGTPKFRPPQRRPFEAQKFAYHIALSRGCDVDKPCNPARSVRWNKERAA